MTRVVIVGKRSGPHGEEVALANPDGTPFEGGGGSPGPWLRSSKNEPNLDVGRLVESLDYVGEVGPGFNPVDWFVEVRREGHDLVRVRGMGFWLSLPVLPENAAGQLWFFQLAPEFRQPEQTKQDTRLGTRVLPPEIARLELHAIVVNPEQNSDVSSGAIVIIPVTPFAEGEHFLITFDFTMVVEPAE